MRPEGWIAEHGGSTSRRPGIGISAWLGRRGVDPPSFQDQCEPQPPQPPRLPVSSPSMPSSSVENEEPQPQDLVAFGLSILKPPPSVSSTNSMTAPAMYLRLRLS